MENRVRNIAGKYRGPVAIHAGLAYDHTAYFDGGPMRAVQDAAAVAAGAEVFPGGYMWDPSVPDPRKAWSVHGAIIGVVDLVDVHLDNTEPCNGRLRLGRCSAWAEPGTHHLVFENPRPLAEPLMFRGALGLRTLDAETEALVRAMIANRGDV